MRDPSTGPIPREIFASLITEKFGEAAKKIRQYDPLWGLAPGQKIEWRVECRRPVSKGVAYVMAATEKEAQRIAREELSSDDIEWDDDPNDFDVVSVKPEPQ